MPPRSTRSLGALGPGRSGASVRTWNRATVCQSKFAIQIILTVVLVFGTLYTGEVPVRAQDTDAPADFAIPAGWFFTEASPGPTSGQGFSVQDGHGALLWSALQSAGGVDALGYPVSRRFEWDGQVAQAFSSGAALRWNADLQQADTLSVAALPGRGPPAYARALEQPPLASAQLDPAAWSGWWWPASGAGGALFAPSGPLDKYDRYVAATTGQDPGTRDWEREHMYLPTPAWAGHCNGAAAAALLEPEPQAPVTTQGITFSVADLKGLLVDYHFGDAASWSYGDEGDLDPVAFQRTLLDWFATRHTGFALTFDLGGGEVWSYAVYGFQTEWAPDAARDELWHVTTTVWLADTNVPTGFVGTRPYPDPSGKQFTYDLVGDPRHPSSGAWTGASQAGRFAHPNRIWYPNAVARNDQRELVSPALDRATIYAILSSADLDSRAPALPAPAIRRGLG
jgi:hypothetical protein